MKITKLLAGTLMLIALNSCKTNREVNKSSSRVDSTTASSKDIAKGTQIYQQHQNNRLDSSFANGQKKYQWQTVNYQFAPVNGLLYPALEQRLTGITVTTEQGTQDVQTGKATQQQTGWINALKDTLTSGEKKSASVNKVEAAKQSATTRKVGSFAWWLIILIVVIVLVIWKGKPILLLIGWIRKIRKDGMPPNSPA